MDPNLIKRALMAIRGQGDQPAAAPQQAAPSAVQPGLAQAYGQPGAGTPQATPSPFQFNQGLEQQAQAGGGQTELEPIIQALMKHLGMMNVIRNQANQAMTMGQQG